MEANELMIGDWVNIYVFPNDEPKGDALFPAQINAILGDSEDVECKFALNGEGKVGYASRPAGTCLPIPLTPEILEKNGFVKQGYPGWLIYTKEYMIQWRNDYPNVLSIDSFSSNCGSFKRFYVDYVHQLQHALRLCGIEKEIEI